MIAAPSPLTVSLTARLARSAKKAGSEGGRDMINRNKKTMYLLGTFVLPFAIAKS
jgi:hypothetical protein